MGENISELGEKAIGQAPKFIDSLARLFPGIARGSEARGVSSAHKTMMRDLERTRDEAERLGLPAATTDALCLEVISGYSKTENLSSCLSFAESSVHDDASGDNVDPSWFLRWQDGAENQCEDEMRVIWGQLLAGELEQPGSYSKRTLSILADMGKDDALAFQKLCGVCLGVILSDGAVDHLVYPLQQPKGFSLSDEDFLRLNALGLCAITGTSGFLTTNDFTIGPDASLAVHCGSGDYCLLSSKPERFSVIANPLTRFGQELSRLCDCGGSEGYETSYLQFLLTKGIVAHRIVSFNADGTFRYLTSPAVY